MTREEKFVLYFKILNRWMYLKNCNIPFSECALLKDKSVAVYGLGELGKRLIEQFALEDRKVEYAIDKQAKLLFADFGLYTLEENLPDVDVVVVTAVADFEEIKQELSKKANSTIISLEEIVNHLWEKCWCVE